jgi:ubiquinone/menaquinone biosynthesis C-methylase UbiE
LLVVSIDILDYRVDAIRAVIEGGWDGLQVVSTDVTKLDFNDNQFSVVTILEVLEHIPNTVFALREAVRVAADFVIVSVPSNEDSNPEHIHLFAANELENLLLEAGACRVSFVYVPNHMIAIANVRDR